METITITTDPTTILSLAITKVNVQTVLQDNKVKESNKDKVPNNLKDKVKDNKVKDKVKDNKVKETDNKDKDNKVKDNVNKDKDKEVSFEETTKVKVNEVKEPPNNSLTSTSIHF